MPAINLNARLGRRSVRAAAPILALAQFSLLYVSASAKASTDPRVAAISTASSWGRCSGHPREIRHLQVSRFRCSMAVKAVRRGKFEFPPAGPQFSTRGFKCESPVGPPLEGPRFTTCRRKHHAFRFYSSAERNPS